MSGLVVRPGDVLVLPAPEVNTREQVEALLEHFDLALPGVKIVIAAGITGNAFVYRPDGDQ